MTDLLIYIYKAIAEMTAERCVENSIEDTERCCKKTIAAMIEQFPDFFPVISRIAL